MVGLICPRCDTQLDEQAAGKLLCKACRTTFPCLSTIQGTPETTIGGVPFLWPEPGAAILDWRNRYNAALADLEQQLAATTAPSSAPPSTTRRIEDLRAALERHQQELIELLEPLNVGPALAKETHLALRTRLPSHHGVLSYAQNTHRDWCWGEDENKQVLQHLDAALQHLSAPPPRTMLVLGCGAGRLAYDLHRKWALDETWALDSNPLLALIGQRMADGDSIPFTEFPLSPVELADAAVARVLKAPQTCSGLHFICADALRLPFAPAQFDLVVTPWLLDVVDSSVAEMMAVIARALPPGGIWLTHGSVAFQGAQPKHRLTATELAEITTANGFCVEYTENVLLPYLQSPASRQRRNEVAYTQISIRGEEPATTTGKRHQHLPDWIVTGTKAVPLTPGFQTQITTTRIHAFIMSLIDGKRSVQDMAQILEAQRLMPADQAAAAIRGFLTTMQEEAVQLDGRASGN